MKLSPLFCILFTVLLCVTTPEVFAQKGFRENFTERRQLQEEALERDRTMAKRMEIMEKQQKEMIELLDDLLVTTKERQKLDAMAIKEMKIQNQILRNAFQTDAVIIRGQDKWE